MNINITCPINYLSYGLVSTNLIKALTKLNHKVALWPIGPIECLPENQDLIKSCVGNQAEYDKNGPSLRIYHQFDLAQHIGKGKHVGWPIFELDKFTQRELVHLHSQDALICCSEWGKEVLAQQELPNISVVPLGVDCDIFLPNPYTSPETTFSMVGKWEVRKNFYELCQAFNKVFEPQDPVLLKIHAYNPFFSAEENDKWLKLFLHSKLGRAGKIMVSGGRVENQEDIVAAIMNSSDCGVYISKAEGFNLPALETLALEKHLIITNYSGHTEFATAQNSLLIEPDGLEVAYDGHFFKNNVGSWMKWGKNQEEQLIGHLRTMHKLKQNRELGPNKNDVREKFTWENSAKKLVEVLNAL